MTPPSPKSPKWLHCGYGAIDEDTVGCRGRRVLSHPRCLADLDEDDRNNYLRSLAPGADIDHSGTTFTQQLLEDLLGALRDDPKGPP